ncbi:MAG TPA: ABC transporter permease [Cyclobacteriaceae bacterium]|nr:ABC transporter permease [Cyclobacteriaceae bacterium]
MLESFIKIGWRNLFRNKGYSAINIGGLAMGISVAILIGLWINDELSFNKNHDNYKYIARVMQNTAHEGITGTGMYMPVPLAAELAKSFENDFEHVVISSFPADHTISFGNIHFTETGNYMHADAPRMFTFQMQLGTASGLNELNSIFLSESTAKRIFGDGDPINKLLTIDGKTEVKVTGVYKDMPRKSEFYNIDFVAPWEQFVASNDWVNRVKDTWDQSVVQVFVQLAPNSEADIVSQKIKNTIYDRESDQYKVFQRSLFLHPMSKWHLYEEFTNGINTGGRIQFVWLFGIICIFILMLACINFMNLSTARSERRAKEVGIRKAVGSIRRQLITQFFSESLLVAGLGFILSIGLVFLVLPQFNQVADKQIDIPWESVYFWSSCIGFTLFTGVVAGSYPALYLSSFQPVKVLKGTFRASRAASIPRKVLVVLQFTVSIALMIGTTTVYLQIQHTKNRPLGYDNDGLIYFDMKTNEIHGHFESVRNKLISSGAIVEMTESQSPVTRSGPNIVGWTWKGKDPAFMEQFSADWISPEYGKTIGWELIAGRDFSRENVSDQKGIVINESAVKYIGLKDPIGEVIISDEGARTFTILGVVKDLVVGSPYLPSTPTIYFPLTWTGNAVTLRLNPERNTQESLKTIQTAFNEFAPTSPFEYKFVNEQYAIKFNNEVRIGDLSTAFSLLSVIISCLGLLGMASFMVEQRTKELGIRKVLGASATNLWQLLSKEFVVLVLIACFIAFPVSSYFMDSWLQRYTYRTELSVWMFAAVGLGALLMTLSIVSTQTIKAVLGAPVKSLRSE